MNPSPSAFEELIRENTALKIENACLQTKVTTLEAEKADLIAENVSLVDKFKEYMQRHPKRVGVKSGKVYEIKPSTPQNPSSNNPDESLEIKRIPGGQPGHKGHSRKKPTLIHAESQIRLWYLINQARVSSRIYGIPVFKCVKDKTISCMFIQDAKRGHTHTP
jgi:hypothetical protein